MSRFILSKCANMNCVIFQPHVSASRWFNKIVILVISFCLGGCASFPLHTAIRQQDRNRAKELINRKRGLNDFNEQGLLPIHLAAKADEVELVKVMLNAGVDIDARANDLAKNVTPLFEATAAGHTRMIEFLLKNGAIPDLATSDGLTPVMRAAQDGNISALQVLCRNKADLDLQLPNGYTSLMLAIQHRHSRCIQELLENGADPDILNADGRSALWLSIKEDESDVVEMLAKNKVDINSINSGMVPLIQAFSDGNIKIVETLIRLGADVNVQSSEGWTPLGWAALNGKPRLVELLLQHGADIDGADISGQTPLYLAAIQNNAEVVLILVENGADIKAKTDENTTVLHAAALGEHPDMIDFFLRLGLRPQVVTGGAEDAYATALAYKRYGQLNLKNGDTAGGREAYETAAEQFSLAAGKYSELIQEYAQKIQSKKMKEFLAKTALVLAQGVVYAAQSYQAASNYKSYSEVAALKQASSNGSGVSGYYSALNAYREAYVPVSHTTGGFPSTIKSGTGDIRLFTAAKNRCNLRAVTSAGYAQECLRATECFAGNDMATEILECIQHAERKNL